MLRQKFVPSPSIIKRKVNIVGYTQRSTRNNSPKPTLGKFSFADQLQPFSLVLNKIKELVFKMSSIADQSEKAAIITEKGNYVIRHFYMYTQDSLMLFSDLLEKEVESIIKHFAKDPLRLLKSHKQAVCTKFIIKSMPKIHKLKQYLRIECKAEKDVNTELIAKQITARVKNRTVFTNKINRTIDNYSKEKNTSKRSIFKANEESPRQAKSVMKNQAVEVNIGLKQWAHEEEEGQLDEFINYSNKVAQYRNYKKILK